MTLQTKKPNQIFPDMPRQSKIVDKDGNMTDAYKFFFDQLILALQTNYKNEGIIFPPLSSAQLATIAGQYTSLINSPLPIGKEDITGQTIFNTDTFTPEQFIITYDASSPAKISSAQWVPFAMMLTYAGDPNGHLGGALNWLCYDSTDNVLYICTTAGSANGAPSPQAVWTGIDSAGDMFLLL